MAAKIIDGKALAAKVKSDVKAQVEGLKSRPGLAVILVGDDPASRVYVNGKKRDCAECGIYSEEYALLANAPQGQYGACTEKKDRALQCLHFPSHFYDQTGYKGNGCDLGYLRRLKLQGCPRNDLQPPSGTVYFHSQRGIFHQKHQDH